ncbi:hypothetical protein HQ45_04650 [Porphyromonas crevioricanis]|uniref:Ig-like domain-containing protein n=1 Tax=Porphyromonas crevioricanis TaxID=393921 RepID=UPI00052BB6E6|nr:Ig-like domain-containing protein [Porphyromonas crevioricanis]KGN90097.1 hypothetical protein HQ45_04650 [Porphyromonas crevioricanis]
MKKVFVVLSMLSVVLLAGFATSCKKDDKGKEDDKVKSLSVDDATVKIGEQVTLKVTVDPAGAKLAFNSSDSKIATVNDKGIVTGVAKGEVTIKVKAGKKDASCKVIVTESSTVNYDKDRVIRGAYFPKHGSMVDQKDEIFAAMGDLKFEYKPGKDDGKYVWPFQIKEGVRPEAFLLLTYVHSHPKVEKPFFVGETFVDKGSFDPDQVKAGFAAAFGFNKDAKPVEVSVDQGGKKAPGLIANNPQLDMSLLMTVEPMEKDPNNPGIENFDYIYVEFRYEQYDPNAKTKAAKVLPLSLNKWNRM